MSSLHTEPGKPFPLGATLDSHGVNFAVYSRHAVSIILCLFDEKDALREQARINMERGPDDVWYIYVRGLHAGTCYGFRAEGPYEPAQGLRFNSNKLLVDPWAKSVSRLLDWDEVLLGYDPRDPGQDLAMDRVDSAHRAPLSRVVDERFNWKNIKRPGISRDKTILYELHVRDLTLKHPEVPSEKRGTFLGLCSPPMLKYFKELGVTALELMPVFQCFTEQRLAGQGLVNHWGYNTLSYFAPERRFATPGGDPVSEFKEMVRTLHEAGLEVILDVVFNHSAEGDELGPTLNLRGLDNLTYYLTKKNKRYYKNFSGCGNTLNMDSPQALRLCMDSLRYWADSMQVDGFRFDLATSLGREEQVFKQNAAFFKMLYQEPALAGLKLFAEPWDMGPKGVVTGRFPRNWAEWNDHFRDDVRNFWNRPGHHADVFMKRMAGSEDLFHDKIEKANGGVNFVTCHDGFTLLDLVSYEEKHNELNGEENRDGSNHNLSWNCGIEGPTDDPVILNLREKQRRNLVFSLILSRGIPLLASGDERGHTKKGNNNTYCQDNELNYIRWEETGEFREFFDFVRRLILERGAGDEFSGAKFAVSSEGSGSRDLWRCFDSEGLELEPEVVPDNSWSVYIPGSTGYCMVFNRREEEFPVTMPRVHGSEVWELLLSTCPERDRRRGLNFTSGAVARVTGQTAELYKRIKS